MVDDLRPELGAYGASWVHSPRIDALAARSTLFERMYTAVAVCGPARSAMLTGRRADATHAWSLSGKEGYWRNHLPNAVSLPQYFKDSGYVAIGLAKLFHPGAISGDDDQAHSWSAEGLPYWHSKQDGGAPAGAPGWWASNLTDEASQDGQTAARAAATLAQLRANRTKKSSRHQLERPFFLGVGFHKPHMPEFCPAAYYANYPDVADIPLAPNPDPPAGVPQVAVQLSKAFRKWLHIENATCDGGTFADWNSTACRVPADLARQLRRAYWACTSFTDRNVGVVLDALTAQGFENDTVVALVGDHGWHLGDKNMWAKYTVFEAATRVPFILHAAGQTSATAGRSAALVEATDIFPTLAAAAGLATPPLCASDADQTAVCVEGFSMMPLVEHAAAGAAAGAAAAAAAAAVPPAWKQAAFSQYPRPDSGINPLPGLAPFPDGEAVMGYSVRTHEFRYSEWVRFDRDAGRPDWSAPLYGRELYSHEASPVPDCSFNDESANLADAPQHAALVANLSKVLRAGWRAQLPLVAGA
jgi:arylsulfatase A-like enzyme